MRLIVAIAAVSFSLGAQAQTAKVIPLTPAEATEAKSLYEQKALIEFKMKDLEHRIQTSHLLDTSTPTQNSGFLSNFQRWLPGWNGGFQYSEDFKFIVPAETSHVGTTLGGWGGGCNYLKTTPYEGSVIVN